MAPNIECRQPVLLCGAMCCCAAARNCAAVSMAAVVCVSRAEVHSLMCASVRAQVHGICTGCPVRTPLCSALVAHLFVKRAFVAVVCVLCASRMSPSTCRGLLMAAAHLIPFRRKSSLTVFQQGVPFM